MIKSYKEYLEISRQRAKQYYIDHKDDPSFKKRKQEAWRRWFKRNKDDPEYKKKHRLAANKWYKKNKPQ